MREGSQSEVQALTATLAAERARRAEADHRARNSLQLVIALLQLLGRRSQEAETRTALNRMQQWVSAIAATHRDLTDDDRFDLTRFVREQAPRLAQNEGEDATIRLNLDQVETERAEGKDIWTAVVEATLSRFRPIMLTAISTVLGLIPIAPTVFWGPMAFAIMGGLFVATLLTLLVLPAFYITLYRAKQPEREAVAA